MVPKNIRTGEEVHMPVDPLVQAITAAVEVKVVVVATVADVEGEGGNAKDTTRRLMTMTTFEEL